METKFYTIRIVIVMSSLWGSQAVEELPCDKFTSLNQDTVTKYRFGDRTNTYETQLSCSFVFEVKDQSEKILLQVFPNCSTHDSLIIGNGNNSCCFGCSHPPSVHMDTVIIHFNTDNYTEARELGFEVIMITGKDKSSCSSHPSLITVGSSPVIITSPNFPEKYPNGSSCTYDIRSEDSSKGLSLTFEVINLEKKCYDFIKLMLNNSKPIIICDLGTTDLALYYTNYTSEGPVNLRFTSDVSYQEHGFRLKISQATTAPITTTANTESSTILSSTATARTKTTTAIGKAITSDESPPGTSTTIIAMAVVIGVVFVCLIGVLLYYRCYRNRSTKESTIEKPPHNTTLGDYEMPVKTHKNEGDGYEELPLDLCLDKKKAVQLNTYDSYLTIVD